MKANVIKSGRMLLLLVFHIIMMNVSAQSTMQKAGFKVQGNCEMCKSKIEAALKVNGIEAAQWNPDSKILKVKFDSAVISLDSIHHLVANAGYDTDTYKADEAAYKNLANCCQYRSGKCKH
ncbi:MAG: heavy-metal-associated domain-containing protein [Chitinophagales bacterium]